MNDYKWVLGKKLICFSLSKSGIVVLKFCFKNAAQANVQQFSQDIVCFLLFTLKCVFKVVICKYNEGYWSNNKKQSNNLYLRLNLVFPLWKVQKSYAPFCTIILIKLLDNYLEL